MTITYIVQREPLSVSSPEAPEDAKQGNRSEATLDGANEDKEDGILQQIQGLD